MNLYEEIEKIKAFGYSEQNAQSKLGQDIVQGCSRQLYGAKCHDKRRRCHEKHFR